MEIYKSNRKNNKIYQKINYVKLLLVIIIPLIMFTIIFYYIGGKQDIGNSIHEACVISLLLGLASIVGDFIDNRSRIFVIDKDTIGYIDIHTEKVGGPYLRDDDFFECVNKYGATEVYNNNYKYEGLDKGIIKDIISIKKKYNRIVLKANISTKEWESSSKYTISKLFVVEKERKKTIIIPNDFDNYVKLYNFLLKKSKM